MGFASVEEQESQLAAYVREREGLEHAIPEFKEQAEEARGRGDAVQAAWLEGRVAECERTLAENAKQAALLAGGASTRRGRAQRR